MGRIFDAAVVGGGHNGLVAAAYLARAGLDVVVLERSDRVGGASVSRSLHPGFTYSSCAYVCSLFRPEIMRELDLPSFGLTIVPTDGGALFGRDGRVLETHRHPGAHRRAMARFSARDAEAYDRFSAEVERQCRFIRPLLLRTPPDPASFRPRDLWEMLFLARRVHALSESQAGDMLRFWTMSVADFVAQYFETEIVRAAHAFGGVIGTALGPMSPGTAYVLLHHSMGDLDGTTGAWGIARGGMGAVSEALAAALRAAGGQVRTGATVARVLVERGRAAGVVLDDGEEVRARRVVSGLDPRRTFLGLVDEAALPADFVAAIRRFRQRGSSAKVNIALAGLPRFPALSEGSACIRGDLHFTDTVERLERAYDAWKAERVPTDPVLDVMVPSTVDPTMAPPGTHVMSVYVQYAPRLVGGREWTDADRDALRDAVLDQIEAHAPGLRDLVLHAEVRTPRDIEAEVGMTGGNIFHGELTFDQLLFNRPVPGWAQYRSPVRGLWMCGSGTHPGGGVMGAPGRNAAREILRDMTWWGARAHA